MNKKKNLSIILDSRESLQQFKERLSKEIRTLRSVLCLTLEQLERETGISRSTISRIEKNTGDYKLDNAFFIIFSMKTHLEEDTEFLSTLTIFKILNHYSFEEQKHL